MATATDIELVIVGKGGTVHGRNAGVDSTLCGKTVAGPVTTPGAELACKACKNVVAKLSGLDNKETETVAETKTETVDETEAAKADIENLINELDKLNKDQKDEILALEAQGNTELMRIKSANKRAPFSMRFKEAIAKAKDRKPGSDLVLRPETKDVTEIEGYDEIVDNAADKVANGIKSEVSAQEMARTVAESILDGRLRVFNKQGLPDLTSTRIQTKTLAKNIYNRAAEKLMAEGYGSDVADVDTLLDSLRQKVQYQMTAVLPAFIYSLDNSPEEFAELFPAQAAALEELRAVDPELSTRPSDLVFDLYGVNRKSKAELAAERRANRAIGAGKTDSEGSEGDESEGESEGDGEGGEEKSQYDKDSAKLDKMVKDLPTIVAHVDDYDDEQREALRRKLSDTLSKISEALGKL